MSRKIEINVWKELATLKPLHSYTVKFDDEFSAGMIRLLVRDEIQIAQKRFPGCRVSAFDSIQGKVIS